MTPGATGNAEVSFSIPLAAELGTGDYEVMTEGQAGGANCTGGTAASPKANSGKLCIYIGSGSVLQMLPRKSTVAEFFPSVGATRTGATLFALEPKAAATDTAPSLRGTWAVTG